MERARRAQVSQQDLGRVTQIFRSSRRPDSGPVRILIDRIHLPAEYKQLGPKARDPVWPFSLFDELREIFAEIGVRVSEVPDDNVATVILLADPDRMFDLPALCTKLERLLRWRDGGAKSPSRWKSFSKASSSRPRWARKSIVSSSKGLKGI